MPKENTKFPEPLSINLPTKGANIAATTRDKVYAPVRDVLENPIGFPILAKKLETNKSRSPMQVFGKLQMAIRKL